MAHSKKLQAYTHTTDGFIKVSYIINAKLNRYAHIDSQIGQSQTRFM